MRQILTHQFRRDVSQCIKHSAVEFGVNASVRYEKLIATALAHIAEDPFVNGSRAFEQVRLYHIQHSKQAAAVDGIVVKKPRHIIAYQIKGDGLVVLRLLYERMDFSSHL